VPVSGRQACSNRLPHFANAASRKDRVQWRVVQVSACRFKRSSLAISQILDLSPQPFPLRSLRPSVRFALLCFAKDADLSGKLDLSSEAQLGTGGCRRRFARMRENFGKRGQVRYRPIISVWSPTVQLGAVPNGAKLRRMRGRFIARLRGKISLKFQVLRRGKNIPNCL